MQIKTDSGETITVNTETVKAVNSGSSGGSNNNSSSNPNSSAPKQNNNSYSQPSSKPSSNNSSKPSNGNNSSQSSKTWHEAEYEYIKHPAETKKIWVVDKAAYTYEEPVYETQNRAICYGCGADITDNIDAHMEAHALSGDGASYGVQLRQVQTGMKTVSVPEQGHYETQTVKEAWTEKKLIREAGWY